MGWAGPLGILPPPVSPPGVAGVGANGGSPTTTAALASHSVSFFITEKEGDNDSASAPPDLIRRFRWSHVVGGGWAAVAEGRDRKALPFPFPFPFLLFPFSFPRLSCASNFAFSARRPFNPPIRCRGISGWRRCGHGLDLEIFQIMRFYSDNSTFFGAFFV